MLVKCPNCDVSFDVEKRGSVCPKCGTDINKMKKKKKTGEEKKAGKGQLYSCLVIICLMVIVAVYAIVTMTKTKENSESLRQVGVVEPKITEMNTKVEIDGDYVQIYDCEILERFEEQLPQGYSLLAVSFATDIVNGAGLKYDTEAYLLLPTGEYIAPIAKETMEEVVKEAGVGTIPGMIDYIDTGNGKLIILISNETTSAKLALYGTADTNSDKYTENIDYLGDVYHFPLEWEVSQ